MNKMGGIVMQANGVIDRSSSTVARQEITIDTATLKKDLENMIYIYTRIKNSAAAVEGKCDVILKINNSLTSGIEDYYEDMYQLKRLKQDIRDMQNAAREAIERWRTYLEGWIELDEQLANDPYANSPGDYSGAAGGMSDYSSYTPSLGSSSYNGPGLDDYSYSSPDYTSTYKSLSGDNSSPYDFNTSSFNYPNGNYDYLSSLYSSTDGGNNYDFGGGSNGYGDYGNSSLFSSSTYSSGLGNYGNGYGTSTLLSSSSYPYSQSSYGDRFGNYNQGSYNSDGLGGSYGAGSTSGSNFGTMNGKGNSSFNSLAGLGSGLKATISKGASKLAQSLPVGGLKGSDLLSAGTIAGLGLTAGGGALAGGLLLDSKYKNYIFTPEDFEELDEETKEEIGLRIIEFSDEDKFEEFKNATFKVPAAELDEHLEKVNKVLDLNTNFNNNFRNLYGYSLKDETNDVNKYLLFVTLVIDGLNRVDNNNIYTLMNEDLDEEEIDFLYSGIDMEEYMVDTDLEDDISEENLEDY